MILSGVIGWLASVVMKTNAQKGLIASALGKLQMAAKRSPKAVSPTMAPQRVQGRVKPS